MFNSLLMLHGYGTNESRRKWANRATMKKKSRKFRNKTKLRRSNSLGLKATMLSKRQKAEKIKVAALKLS